MRKISETLETSVNYSADVLVAGGGVGGIAAAISAAREGASVILLEKGFCLGGLATAGLVTIYLPLCDGMGHQVSYGIAEELFRLSIEHGAEARYPKEWLDGGTFEERRDGKRFVVQFNPHFFAISAEKLLVSLGVRILYGVSAVATNVSGGKITEVVIEGKSGREAIEVKKCVIDATGDADIAYMSGAKCHVYPHKNTLAAWYYWDKGEGYKLNALGYADVVSDNAERNIGHMRYTGLDTTELSDMMIHSHAAIEKDILERRAAGEGNIFPTCIATIPQVRITRGIEGITRAACSDDKKYYDESVGLYSNWTKRGPVYELRFSSLYGRDIKNLLAVGRCMSSEDDMWNITRVIPVCAVSGEAAGVAAAMTDDVGSLDVKLIQEKLKERGVLLHTDEVK